MVEYTEHWGHKLINKLVVVSVFIVVVMLLCDYVFKIEIPDIPARILDLSINIIFIIDLMYIYKNSESTKKFLMKNWLDIIACIPFNELFRAAKLVRLTKITRAARVASRQTKLAKVIKANKLNRLAYLKSSKVFSHETDFKKQMDLTRDKIFDLKMQRNDRDLNDIIKALAKLQK